jgi:protein arginine N-methyltransferase 5
VRHLWTSRPPLDDTQAFESPFYDYLQIPLQPLADNLESNTYEVFEQDPVKYMTVTDFILFLMWTAFESSSNEW